MNPILLLTLCAPSPRLVSIVSIVFSVSDRELVLKKYLDFIICDRDSMKLLGTIDLVDTQGKGYKIKKDWFVSGALEAASIPHIRIKVKPSYSIDEIRACINSRILGNKAPAPKMRGRVIPAPMVKARPKNTGVITATAAQAQSAGQIPAPQVAALPH